MKIDKAISRKNFEGSNQLFESCWRKYLSYLNGSIDNPDCQENIDSWLETIASEKVNDSKSKFYIYG